MRPMLLLGSSVLPGVAALGGLAAIVAGPVLTRVPCARHFWGAEATVEWLGLRKAGR